MSLPVPPLTRTQERGTVRLDAPRTHEDLIARLATQKGSNAPTREEICELVDLVLEHNGSSVRSARSLSEEDGWERLRYLVLRVTDFARSKL